MQNVETNDSGKLVVCGEDIGYTAEEVVQLTDAGLKRCRDQYAACSVPWQFFQCMRDGGKI